MTVMLLEWVFTSVFLILTVLVLRAAFGRRVSARLRYILWAVVLVRLLVPVQLFTSPIAGTRVFSENHTGQNIYKVTDEGLEKGGPEDILALGVPDGPSVSLSNFPQAPNPPTLPDAPEPPAAPDLTKAPAWLGWIWLGSSAAVAVVLTAFNLRFARRLRRCRVPVEGADCPLRVYAAVGLPSPCLFGLVRPAVYVTPEAAADPAMLRHVVAHEYTHFRHGDHVWSFLRCVVLAIHWWNPLVWLAVVLSRRDGELACDEGALKRLGEDERMAYGNTLLALVTAKPSPGELLCFATTMAGEKRSLKERISRIACAPKRWLWAAVAVVLATALACVCAFGQAAEDEPDDSTPSQDVGGTSLLDGSDVDLSFSIEDVGSGPFVRIEGKVGNTTLEKVTWNPEASDALFGERFGGELSMTGYQFASGKAWVTAWWTDESRTSVTASTLLSAAVMSNFSGYWTFTVDISGETGVITEMTANPLWEDQDVQMQPEVITDEEAIALARVAAKVMTAAEDYYSNWAASQSTASGWKEEVDLNRNGVPETLQVSGTSEKMVLKVLEDGEVIWSDEGYHAHAGYNAVFLCTMDGQDYLLRYNPYMAQGWGDYSYKLFTLENGEETVVEESSVEFDIHADKPQYTGPFEPDLIATFMAKVNYLLANSVQLINTDSDLLDTFQRRGGLEDDLGWLDGWAPVFVRDEYKSLYDNLCIYLAAMEPYGIPTVRMLDWDRDLVQLSYHGKQKQFTAAWDYLWHCGPECRVADLNGDGRDEITVILNTGHGSGCDVYELYLFDAETLEQYDTSTLTRDIIGQVERTGDKNNFYLSASGMGRVSIARSLFNPELPLADVIGMGEIVCYTVKDGRLVCTIGCDASGLSTMYCGYLYVMLDFDGEKVQAASYYYVPDQEYDPTRELYRQVLTGEQNFTLRTVNRDYEAVNERSTNIADIPKILAPYDDYMELWDFTVVDMDRDGANEVLVYGCGVSSDMSGYLLLHQMDGRVYGLLFDSAVSGKRWFGNLKSDGTFERYDPTGTNWMSINRLGFSADGGYTFAELAFARSSNHEEYDSFEVNHKTATKAEYEAVVAGQDKKPDAVWSSFTPEHIDEMFG